MAADRHLTTKGSKTMKRNLFAALTLTTLVTAGALSAQTPTATEKTAASEKTVVSSASSSSSTHTTTSKPATKTVVKSKRKHVTKRKAAPKKTTTYTLAPPKVEVKVKPQ